MICKSCKIIIQSGNFCSSCRNKISRSKITKPYNCEKCNKLVLPESKFGIGIFCCRKCSNSRIHSQEIKNKISTSLKRRPDKICPYCKKCFNSKSKSCSRSCSSKLSAIKVGKLHFIKMGRNSSKSRVKRSKNEIYLSELLSKNYEILTNANMFNGWDADIIIPKLKLAVLWNGIWHYKKVMVGHSLDQVKNRDKIKIKEIIRSGYIPYVIKDMGKHNSDFVELEYHKLIKFIEQKS